LASAFLLADSGLTPRAVVFEQLKARHAPKLLRQQAGKTKDVAYRRGRRVRGADDGDAEGGVDGVGKAQAGADGGTVFYGA